MNTFLITYVTGKTRTDTVSDCDTVEEYVMSRFGLSMEEIAEYGTKVEKVDRNKPADVAPAPAKKPAAAKTPEKEEVKGD